jgi:hypothetical protein
MQPSSQTGIVLRTCPASTTFSDEGEEKLAHQQGMIVYEEHRTPAPYRLGMLSTQRRRLVKQALSRQDIGNLKAAPPQCLIGEQHRA